MYKFLTIFLMLGMLYTLTACASGESPGESEAIQEHAAAESQIITSTPTESIAFYGETYYTSDADYTDYDEDGNLTFVLFYNIGFIGLADGNREPLYQKVELGQTIGGAMVAEGTNMGFDYINGNWELTESDVFFTGPVKFIGELRKTPESELEIFAPGTLTFTAIESESGLVPYMYGHDDKLQFMLDGYDPMADYPGLFSESDTVYVNATLDSFRIFKTERATGMNYATLASIELLDKTE